MKITQIETLVYQPTWDDPFADRHRRIQVAVTIRIDEGLEGISRTWGEYVPAIHDLFTPLLIGEDPRNVERLQTKMQNATVPFLGRERDLTMSISALDIALWDLLGKSTGLPCWQLLGGHRNWIPVYADIPIRANTPEGVGAELAACVDAGYSTVKFHIVDRDPEQIVAQTRAARAAIGPNVNLCVDIFRALDPKTAIDVARRIEEYDIFWLEEPVRWHDQALGLARVAQRTSIPIAGGEGESTIYGCRTILERPGIAYLQTDPIICGGYTALRKIAGMAEAYHVEIAPHGATIPELTAPIVAAVPNGAIVPATTPQFPPAVWADLYEDFQITSGEIHLSDAPGLGLTFNRDFLERYQVEVIRSS